MQQRLFPVSPASMTKRCPKCLVGKSIYEFATRGVKPYRPSSYCRECQRVYCRAHYARNKVEHNTRRRKHQREYARRNRQLFKAFLVGKTCVDCGNANPVVLEFDHVRGRKQYEVSIMISAGFAWRRVLAEIAKCEIRCANCHRIKTAAQFGWRGRRCDED